MPCYPRSKTVHCRICGKTIKGKDFAERMAKLRRHRKQAHPKAHRESVRKSLKTKGILDPDTVYSCPRCGKRIKGLRNLRKHMEKEHGWKFEKPTERLDPEKLKARRGLINKPRVLAVEDIRSGGLVRLLRRQEDIFPEFALYPKRKFQPLALKFAGFNEESRGKWVLRTNKFNIFVYL